MGDIFKHAYSLIAPEQKKKEWYEEIEEQACALCPSLSYQQRLIGCAICVSIGFLLSLGSTLRIVSLLEGRPESFAIMYTLGNMISICATCFIFGPWAQFKKMFAANRFVTTCIYFFFMGLTLFLAFYPKYIPLRVLFLVISIFCQFLALAWYTISYIPFARDVVKTFCKQTCCRNCQFNDQGNEEDFFL